MNNLDKEHGQIPRALVQNCLGLSILQEDWISSEIWCILCQQNHKPVKSWLGFWFVYVWQGGRRCVQRLSLFLFLPCGGHKERGRGRKKSGREKPGAGSRGAGEIGWSVGRWYMGRCAHVSGAYCWTDKLYGLCGRFAHSRAVNSRNPEVVKWPIPIQNEEWHFQEHHYRKGPLARIWKKWYQLETTGQNVGWSSIIQPKNHSPGSSFPRAQPLHMQNVKKTNFGVLQTKITTSVLSRYKKNGLIGIFVKLIKKLPKILS